MTTEKCPQGVLLEQVTRNWDSCIGVTLVWPRGSGRFPMRGELLQAFDDRKVYSVSVGDVLRFLAKAHDAWDHEQLKKHERPGPTAQRATQMTPRQAADLRLRLAAERLQRANDELEAAEREHVLAAAAAAIPIECGCAARTCHPEDNVGKFCWRSGCPIYATDFPSPSTSDEQHTGD